MTLSPEKVAGLREVAAQPFERYPALASWIERLANSKTDLSLGEWGVFVGALNQAIVAAERLPVEDASQRVQSEPEPNVVERAEEQVRTDASNRMQHNTTSDLSARLMCRVGFRELTLLLAHYDQLKQSFAERLALLDEVERLRGIEALARELVSAKGMVNRGVDRGLVVIEKADRSDPHYRLCTALEASRALHGDQADD